MLQRFSGPSHYKYVLLLGYYPQYRLCRYKLRLFTYSRIIILRTGIKIKMKLPRYCLENPGLDRSAFVKLPDISVCCSPQSLRIS